MKRNTVSLDEAIAAWRALSEEQRTDFYSWFANLHGLSTARVALDLLRAAAEPEAKATRQTCPACGTDQPIEVLDPDWGLCAACADERRRCVR